MSKKYKHYGNTCFIPALVRPIKNIPDYTKPHGGIWASPVDAEFGWKDWCKEEHFRECREDNSFCFTLAENAKVAVIDSIVALDGLPRQECDIKMWTVLDFEKMVQMGYDAIEFVLSSDYRLYMALYGWDCDSILVMNPEVIREVTK